MEHLQAYIDSLDKEPESSDDEEDTHDKTDLHDMLSQSNSVNELQMISSVRRILFYLNHQEIPLSI